MWELWKLEVRKLISLVKRRSGQRKPMQVSAVTAISQDLRFHRSVNPKMLYRLGRASESATTKAAPFMARFTAFSVQFMWIE